MNIEKAIKNLHHLANWDEEIGCLDSASEKRQIAGWLQELKERREKESRGINFDKPFVTIKVDKDMIQRAIDEAIDNLYYECKNCGQKMIPQRKEESK